MSRELGRTGTPPIGFSESARPPSAQILTTKAGGEHLARAGKNLAGAFEADASPREQVGRHLRDRPFAHDLEFEGLAVRGRQLGNRRPNAVDLLATFRGSGRIGRHEMSGHVVERTEATTLAHSPDLHGSNHGGAPREFADDGPPRRRDEERLLDDSLHGVIGKRRIESAADQSAHELRTHHGVPAFERLGIAPAMRRYRFMQS